MIRRYKNQDISTGMIDSKVNQNYSKKIEKPQGSRIQKVNWFETIPLGVGLVKQV